MAMTMFPLEQSRFPLLALLHLRSQTRRFLALLVLGLLVSRLAMLEVGLPLWGATIATLGLLIYPIVQKWREDAHAWGRPVMVLSILLTLQTFHTLEHLTQWFQFHVLGWPAKQAGGLISPLNAEVVHFIWNWSVLLTIEYLLWAGLRNRWMWLLLVWAMAHTAEHTYMFTQYLYEVNRLSTLGLPSTLAQGLPGFFGKGGVLATHARTTPAFAFVCQLAPALRTAPRLDVHFWWNIGEVVLLLPAAHTIMRRHISTVVNTSSVEQS